MEIYRYEKRIWLAIEGENGIKESKDILEENKKKPEFAEYLKAAKKSAR